MGKSRARTGGVYGPILKSLRIARGRSQAEVARTVGISPAQLARLESNQRGLYVEDFVRIAEALGEKPGNLMPNDLGELGRLKPLIDRLSAVPPELLDAVASVVDGVVAIAERSARKPSRNARPGARKGRR